MEESLTRQIGSSMVILCISQFQQDPPHPRVIAGPFAFFVALISVHLTNLFVSIPRNSLF